MTDAGKVWMPDTFFRLTSRYICFGFSPTFSISCLSDGFELLLWQEREGGSVPQHPRAKRLHSHLSRWLRPLQHQVLDHPHIIAIIVIIIPIIPGDNVSYNIIPAKDRSHVFISYHPAFGLCHSFDKEVQVFK